MIYLDYNATSPISPRALAIISEIGAIPLNPSSIHYYGRKGKQIIENSRRHIAQLVGIGANIRDYDIVFTSCGTEANNLMLNNYSDGEIFISAIEHPSVSMYAKYQDNVRKIDVKPSGIIDLEALEAALASSKANRKLVSVMLANNETGVIQPLKEIKSIAGKYGADMHSDCVQGPGKLKMNLSEWEVDFATISGHKFGGMTGVGALIMKNKHVLKPQIIGGGQEKSMRSGTENVLGIAALGAAAEEVLQNLDANIDKMQEVRNYLESKLMSDFPEVEIIGSSVERLPNTTLLIVNGKKSEMMVVALDLAGIAVSSGSACSSGKVRESEVLKAMGYKSDMLNSALRVSVGAGTTKEEIDVFLSKFREIIS